MSFPIWRSQPKRGVLITWLVSYILVLMLPVITWMASFYFSHSIIREQTDQINEGMLTLLCEAIDKRIAELILDSQILMLDDNISSLVSRGSIESPHDVYSVMQAKNTMMLMTERNNIVNSIYLHLPKNDYIISDQTAVSASMYHSIFINGTGIYGDTMAQSFARGSY